ncbi:MAG: glycosyltransferase family 4 protein [Paludibacter sp.]
MPEEILCITHKYPPFIGGMEKQSYELIKGLSAYYTTRLIAYQGNENKILWFIKLRSRVKAILKKHPNIKLIHLNDGTMGFASLWLQNITRIPVVVTYHGLDITYPVDFFQNRLVPKLRKYNGAICVSEFTRQECLKRGFDEKTTFTVNNGVEHSLGDIPYDETIVQRLRSEYNIDVSNKKVIVSTGRPVKRKGFSWFLKNVMPLLDEDILFLMIGPLTKKQTLVEKFMQNLPLNIGYKIHLLFGFSTDKQDVIDQLTTQKNAYHLGKVSDADLLQILSLADLFVMPNLSIPGDVEGFGLVALEASMRGTYIVASGIDGITDAVIDNKNGTLLPAGNAQAWADKIHELLSDKEKLQILSARGKDYTRQHYSWEIMANGYKEVFDRFIHLR